MIMKSFKFFGIIMMLVMGMSFASCSDDDDKGGSSQSLIGTWKLTKVVWYDDEDGKYYTDDYSDGNPDDGLDNYLVIGDRTISYFESLDDDNSYTVSYEAKDDKLLISGQHGDSWYINYKFEGSQLVFIDGDEKYYYKRLK